MITVFYENRKRDYEKQRDKVNAKIEKLYGPISANRILHRCALDAIEKAVGKSTRLYIADLCVANQTEPNNPKNYEELENWRCYYLKHLYTLDVEFKDIVKHNLQEARNKNDVDRIHDILREMSHHHYQMETWQHVHDGLVLYSLTVQSSFT